MEFECSSDFGFGFNDAKFSDKTLRLCIIPDFTVDSDSVRKQKRPRVDDSNGNDAAAQTDDNQSSADCSATKSEMKTLHISSIILAEKSPFFYKLFSNGMTESNQQHVTLQIQHSEEAAVMDLLKFMYTKKLSSTTPSALLGVLMAADKYEVASCMKSCIQLLQKLPMTLELALLYLDLPSTILRADTVQSLTDAAKEFLISRFKDVDKFEEEMLRLPLVGIEAVLSSDDLEVDTEDDIYDFVIEWAQRHYTKSDERQDIFTTRLHHLIRFQFMSVRALKKVLNRSDIKFKVASNLVVQALSFKIPHTHLASIPLERAYKFRPVKVIRFDSPLEECHVYLDLKHEECARLLPSHQIYSQNFELAEQEFYLTGQHNIDEQTSVESFGFYLGKEEAGLLNVAYQFSWREFANEEFVYGDNFYNDFAQVNEELGTDDLFEVPWETFIAKDSPYFINGVLRLRVVLTIKK